VPTGIAVALPEGLAGLIWDKSGLAVKQGISVMAGVIDAGYRGEIIVCIINHGKENVVIRNGQKISQLITQPVFHPDIVVVNELPEASDQRGEGGFGSTGI